MKQREIALEQFIACTNALIETGEFDERNYRKALGAAQKAEKEDPRYKDFEWVVGQSTDFFYSKLLELEKARLTYEQYRKLVGIFLLPHNESLLMGAMMLSSMLDMFPDDPTTCLQDSIAHLQQQYGCKFQIEDKDGKKDFDPYNP